MAALIEFQGVRTRFGEELVLDGISFSVERGEFVCLLGPTGCGKSTTLRIVGNLLDRYEGTVRINGRPPAEGWRRLAYVFQSPRLVHWRNTLDNVQLGLELRGSDLSKEERRERALRALRLVRLEDAAAKYPGVLSGGERQRVAIARALGVDPDVILMDEPFASLDVQTRHRLREELLKVWQETKKTIIFVTHDIEEALTLADRVIVLSDKPTRILATHPIGGSRPRDVASDPALLAIGRELRQLFDEPAAG